MCSKHSDSIAQLGLVVRGSAEVCMYIHCTLRCKCIHVNMACNAQKSIMLLFMVVWIIIALNLNAHQVHCTYMVCADVHYHLFFTFT